MNTNIERIDNSTTREEVKEQLPQTEAALIALLLNRIELYRSELDQKHDEIVDLNEQLQKAKNELSTYDVKRNRTLYITNEPAKFKRDLEDKIKRIHDYWL